MFLVSAVQQSESAIHIHTYTLFGFPSQWGHHRAPSRDPCITEQVLLVAIVQYLSHVQLFATPWTTTLWASLSSPSPGVYSNSCPSSRWCHPTISSFVVPFSSCLQSFPASGSSQMNQLFASDGQNTGVSASASVLPMNIQDWFPLELTDLISLQSKALSRVFSQHHNSKASILRRLVIFITQLSHPYMTTGNP